MRACEGSSGGERKAGRVGKEGRRIRRDARSLTAAWTDTSFMGSDESFGGCWHLKYNRAKPITKGRYLREIRQFVIPQWFYETRKTRNRPERRTGEKNSGPPGS